MGNRGLQMLLLRSLESLDRVSVIASHVCPAERGYNVSLTLALQRLVSAERVSHKCSVEVLKKLSRMLVTSRFLVLEKYDRSLLLKL